LKEKSQVTKQQKSRFFLLFLLNDRIWIGFEVGSGSIPLTNGSGSNRPKNTRIRIRNTAFKLYLKAKIPVAFFSKQSTSQLFSTKYRKVKEAVLRKHIHWIRIRIQIQVFYSVADPDPRSDAFLTTGTGIRNGKNTHPGPGRTSQIIFPRAFWVKNIKIL
jgi:hypothetical protein